MKVGVAVPFAEYVTPLVTMTLQRECQKGADARAPDDCSGGGVDDDEGESDDDSRHSGPRLHQLQHRVLQGGVCGMESNQSSSQVFKGLSHCKGQWDRITALALLPLSMVTDTRTLMRS